MPTGKHYDPAITGKTQKPSMWDYVEVLKDVRVVVMIFQYSACFGFLAASRSARPVCVCAANGNCSDPQLRHRTCYEPGLLWTFVCQFRKSVTWRFLCQQWNRGTTSWQPISGPTSRWRPVTRRPWPDPLAL